MGNLFANLSQREKTLLGVAGAFLLIFLFRWVYSPIVEYRDKITKQVTKVQKQSKKIESLGQELSYLRKQNVVRSSPLVSKVNRLIRNMGMAGDRYELREGTKDGQIQKVNLTLKSVYTDEMAEVIYKLENFKPVILISNLDIRPSLRDKELLQVKLTLGSI